MARINHQRVGFTACAVVREDILLGDSERPLRRRNVAHASLFPCFVFRPAGEKVPREVSLLVGFDVTIESGWHRHVPVTPLVGLSLNNLSVSSRGLKSHLPRRSVRP